MQKSKLVVNALATLSMMLVFTSLAQAQSRSWVASNGDDAFPCSRTAPCKTFAGAISKTDEGGEIDVLDPNSCGALTITKAITIDGGTGSGWASVLSTGTNGILINVATSGINHPDTAAVVLRNITFNGVSQTPGSAHGNNGINYTRAERVYVENCVFENFTNSGILMSMTEDGSLWVKDCRFDKTTTGIRSTTTTGFAVVNVDHSRFSGMTNGVNAVTNAFVTIRDSYFGGLTGATNGGVTAQTSSAANVDNCMFANNIIGVNIAGGTVRLSNNSFFNNATAIAGGTAESANNNKFAGNTSDGSTNNVIVVK
jgi:hypothetical protein